MQLDMIQKLDTLTLEEAITSAIEMVDTRNVKTINQKTAKAQVIRDLKSAPSVKEVSRIMWQQYLAGEGLRTQGSACASKYKNI